MSTIAAIATPAAAGGVGIVRLSGEDAVEIAQSVFKSCSGKKLSELCGYRACLGKVYDGEELLDECIATVFRAPKSYTGEDVAELSCHGGLYVMQRVLRAVLSRGAVAAQAGEFTKRAFLNGKIDLTRAEAVMQIVSAHGKQALSAAANTLNGAIAEKIREITGELLNISAAMAVWTDDPDEDVCEAHEDNLLKVISSCLGRLDTLIKNYDNGAVYTQGVPVALAGKPNVGKSTLMNLLTGFDRSIVTSVAGTTRDIVEETVLLGDIKLRLADTAGIRESGDEVESIGVARALEKIEGSTLIIAVFDGSRELDGDDVRLLKACRDKKALAVINKSDLKSEIDEEQIKKYISKTVILSAKNANGSDELEAAVKAALGAADIDASSGILSGERQYSCCVAARELLQEAFDAVNSGVTLDAVNVCVDNACAKLLELTGDKVTDRVVDEIFSHFCVGK